MQAVLIHPVPVRLAPWLGPFLITDVCELAFVCAARALHGAAGVQFVYSLHSYLSEHRSVSRGDVGAHPANFT